MKVLMFAKAANQVALDRMARGDKPSEEAIVAMHAFNEELEKAGVLVDLGGLMPGGARIQYKGKRRKIIDGPFAEAKELIAGYSILEVKSLEEALEWAKRAPYGIGLLEDEEWEVEIRPLFDPSMFEPS